MPVRRTKRGADRTPLSGSYDVLICGASFAGLAVARELVHAEMCGAYDLDPALAVDVGVGDNWAEAKS